MPHVPISSIDSGVAGASARREHERRAGKRDADVREKWGDRVGGWILRLSDEPQSTRAWRIGADGEEALGAALEQVGGVRILNDRGVRGTRRNIDHVVIGPAGVFVIDAKNYRGSIRVRDRGGLFRTDLRLYVGGRDCSKLAHDLGWQVEVVDDALASAALSERPPVTPVLCFVDGDWPLIRRPSEFAGVRLEGIDSLRRLVSAPARLTADTIDAVTAVIAHALPPK